jgi:hypothetical protein
MSCAGAWAWGEVPGRLRAAGHEVDAPDFTLRAGATPARERGWTVLQVDAEHLLPLIDPAITAKVLADAADSVRPGR